MIEAVTFWNEPNNKSHWDLELDPEWRLYAQMVKTAAQAVKQPVLARMVSTVTRIPGWVGSNVVGAAAWVVDLPGQVVRLPERRFL